MAFYNNGFPATYQPMYQPQQIMTPPTIRAEIIQVDNEEAAANYPVGAGASQMMIAKDDSAIYVKTANANGYTLDVFTKRPPAPPAPKFIPEEYVRKDELEKLLASMVTAKKEEKK